MPNFRGLNTIKQYKKFTMVDKELIKRDLMNAFLIRAGEMPGKPEIGTTLWSYIFEPNTVGVQTEILEEVKRIISLDPRITLDDIFLTYDYNTVFVEIAVFLHPETDLSVLILNFDKEVEVVTITEG